MLELPIELQNLLALGIGAVVAFAFTQLAKYIPFLDLSGYKSQVVAALFSVVMVFVNAAFAQIPADKIDLASGILQFAIIVLGALGVHGLWKQVKK